MSHALIYVEHQNGAPKKASLNAISFAKQWVGHSGGQVHLLVAGHNVGAVADALKPYGAHTIHVADAACFEHYNNEAMVEVMHKLGEKCGATLLAGAASSQSKDFMPRLAARTNAAFAADVLQVIDAKTFKRPMWAGNVIATVSIESSVKVATVRATDFDTPETGADAAIAAFDCAVDLSALKTKFVALKEVKSERPDATTANVVVSGGRGVKGPEGFELIEKLADALNAGVGASRAVCDAGWCANDLQIGQTGKVVAPNLYFAIGISGAIQHLAGMKSSKVIVAINKDPEAPIFQVADYGVVTDLFTAIPELMKHLA